MERLWRAWPARRHGLRVALHLTPCIVAAPPGTCDALVNSANEQLVGTRFTPSQAVAALRGGLVYPPQVVDGVVDERGGPALWRACASVPIDRRGVRCAVGAAVLTAAAGELCVSYRAVVHAVAPLYGAPRWSELLRSAFDAAFAEASRAGLATLAVPLLGAGAKGAPPREAAAIAAAAIAEWTVRDDEKAGGLREVRLAVQDESIADVLCESLDRALRNVRASSEHT
ncbi:hypothetical protein AB1Y20_012793 [Prymnesium parvum]|uniref:Macro domain-containing protein n=1 Tax=Prymnesium parvum TaxID=97485 RepID=A0AB34ILN0_PRYPA